MIRTINLIISFLKDHSWGIVYGAFGFTAIALIAKIFDIWYIGAFLESENAKHITHNCLSTIHTIINTYWNTMGTLNIVILLITFALAWFRAQRNFKRLRKN
jgi:hypothetical protein